jgi:hypothetical protein
VELTNHETKSIQSKLVEGPNLERISSRVELMYYHTESIQSNLVEGPNLERISSRAQRINLPDWEDTLRD